MKFKSNVCIKKYLARKFCYVMRYISNPFQRLWYGDIILKFVIMVVLFMYGIIFYYVIQYGFWRHDAITYLQTFDKHLLQEGRWVNYLFFDLLHAVPPFGAWLMTYASIATFLWFVASRNSSDNVVNVLLVGALLATPGLYAQLNWPASIFLAAVLLAVSTLVVDRVPFPVFTLGFSIIAFGINASAIYVLPLFYLHRRFENWRAAALWWSRFIACWGMSFLAGYAIANLAVWLKFGKTITLASWRRPNPAHDFSDFLRNIKYSFDYLQHHVVELFPAGGILLASFILLMLLAAAKKVPGQRWISFGVFLVMGVGVAVCQYVITALHGVGTAYRTTVSLFWGLSLAYWGLMHLGNRRLIAVVVFLLIGLPAWHASYKNVLWFSATTSKIRATIRQSVPRPIANYRGIVVDTRDFDHYFKTETAALPQRYRWFFERLDTPMRWARGLTEEGAREVLLCPFQVGWKLSDQCKAIFETPGGSACAGESELICVAAVTKNNHIVLKLMK